MGSISGAGISRHCNRATVYEHGYPTTGPTPRAVSRGSARMRLRTVFLFPRSTRQNPSHTVSHLTKRLCLRTTPVQRNGPCARLTSCSPQSPAMPVSERPTTPPGTWRRSSASCWNSGRAHFHRRDDCHLHIPPCLEPANGHGAAQRRGSEDPGGPHQAEHRHRGHQGDNQHR